MNAITVPARARRTVSATVLALLVVALAATLGTPAASAAPVAITEGSVEWGFKQSWRTYIGESGITVSGGVTRTADGGFDWPIASGSYDTETRALELRLAGSVHFTAHNGLLDSTLSAGHLLIGGEGTELRFDIRSKNMAGDWVEFTDAPLALLDVEAIDPVVADGKTTWTAIPNAITEQGNEAFTYGAGTLLDPLSISYTGPGGKPDLAERWTTPGTRGYAKTHVRDLLPGADWAPSLRNGAFDEQAGILHAIGYPRGESSAYVLAIDLSTGAIVDQAGPVFWPTSGDTSKGPFAYDAAHRTVFGRTAANELVAYDWNLATRSYGSAQVLDDATPSGASMMTYDPVGETVGLMATGGALVLVTRDEDGDFGAPVKTTVTGGGTGNNFVIDAEGKALLTRASTTERLLWFDTTLPSPAASVIAGAASNTGIVTLGRDGEAWVAGTVTSFQKLQRVERTEAGYVKSGDPLTMPTVITRLQSGPGGDLIYGPSLFSNQIHVFGDGRLKATIDVDGPADYAYKQLIVHVRDDGDLLVLHPDPTLAAGSTAFSWPLDRYDFTGTSPGVAEQPADQTVTLQAGEQSAPVQLSVETSGTPAPQVRWQSRAGGIGRFADIPGATGPTFELDGERSDNGVEYRAVLENVAGSFASDPATLTVNYPPEISQQPLPVTVVEGEDAVLKVMPTGNPHPTVTWQRKVDGFWQPVDPESGDFELSGEGNGFLTIKQTNVAQSGAVFRAKVSNTVGTTFSNPVALTVEATVSEPVTFGSGHVDWGFANRWRCYVTGSVAQGGIEVSGGVTRVPGTEATGSLCAGGSLGSEALRFPVRGGSYDPETGELEVKLNGAVRFWGHAHHAPGDTTPLLDTRFSNLRIVVTGTTGILYADATGATMENPTPVTHADVPLVSVDVSGTGPVPTGDGLAWSEVPSLLTAAGAEVFGSYPEGEPFDPISMSLIYGTPQLDPEEETGPQPDPRPQPQPQPRPEARGKAAKVTAVGRAQRVGPKRGARLATLACPAGSACKVTAPKRVTVKIAGRRYRVVVLAPARIAAGKKAVVRVRLSKKAAKRLVGRHTTVKLRLVVSANGNKVTRTITVKLKGRAKPKPART